MAVKAVVLQKKLPGLSVLPLLHVNLAIIVRIIIMVVVVAFAKKRVARRCYLLLHHTNSIVVKGEVVHLLSVRLLQRKALAAVARPVAVVTAGNMVNF
jgi:hypothetical protein